jgi:hypothetical protein
MELQYINPLICPLEMLLRRMLICRLLFTVDYLLLSTIYNCRLLITVDDLSLLDSFNCRALLIVDVLLSDITWTVATVKNRQ